jgi:hypothetical protein
MSQEGDGDEDTCDSLSRSPEHDSMAELENDILDIASIRSDVWTPEQRERTRERIISRLKEDTESTTTSWETLAALVDSSMSERRLADV